MNKIDTSKISNWFFKASDKIGKLSTLYRILLCLGVFVLLAGPFLYFSFLPKLDEIDKLANQSTTLEKKLNTAQKKASQLKMYEEKLENAKLEFKVVTKKLPEKQEIPSLLSNISQSARDAGLEIILFQPLAEHDKDFYAEIPVSITVKGNYQDVVLFFDKVSRLSRIVNIDNIRMNAAKGSDKLTTSCTAITYRFIETKPKKQTKRKKASR